MAFLISISPKTQHCHVLLLNIFLIALGKFEAKLAVSQVTVSILLLNTIIYLVKKTFQSECCRFFWGMEIKITNNF